jgi:RNA polymerase-binding transcription factor DksA
VQNKVRKSSLSKARREFLGGQLSALIEKLSGLRKLLKQIRAYLAETEKVSFASGHGLDTKAAVIVDEEVNVRELERFAKNVRDCDETIDFIRGILAGKSADLYGKCSNCDKRIPKKRLKLVPWASMCVPCQEAGRTTE